jgi:hypothetical protein
MSEARIPTHRYFQKQNHARMAKADLNKLLILDSGVARLPGGGPPIDYGALVQAALDGVAGFAFDPTDAAVLFQDTAGATPVTADGQGVARVNTKWGTVNPNWQQATVANRPVRTAGRLVFDGTTDMFDPVSSRTFATSMPAFFWCGRVRLSLVDAQRTLLLISTSSSTVTRVGIDYLATGSLRLAVRRLNADAGTIAASDAGVIAANTDYVVTVQMDYAGTGVLRVYVNGTQVATATHGSVGNSDGSLSARARLGANLAATPAQYFAGQMGRSVLAPKLMSDAERAAIETWVGQS